MRELKDPSIKLFGKTIQLLPDETVSATDNHHEQASSTSQVNKKSSGDELIETKHENSSSQSNVEEVIDPTTPSANTTKKEDPNETSNSEEKMLKKPDKILPCPRCNSMDTKFCYHNNYNVNQPRHFCKSCQRYWTAGGTMRSVPVGSGRRKNKSSAPNYRHIIVSEALQAARADAANGIHSPSLKSNGSVLTFASGEPLSESLASVLSLAEKSRNGDDYSSGCYSSVSNSTEQGGNADPQESIHSFQGFPPQVPCFFPWNSSQWRSPMPTPAFGPVSFYPAPYWGCTVPNPWNMPWLSPAPSSPVSSSFSTSPNSPTLGKHSRDGNLEKENPLEEKDSRRGVWIPKTLRIDDPSEAAKNSLWTTLGIRNENADSINTKSPFKAFRSKGDEKNHIVEPSLALQANPAALSRSLNFQESA